MSLLSRILVFLASVIVVFTVGLLEGALFELLNVSSLFIVFIMVGVVAPALNTRLLWIITLVAWYMFSALWWLLVPVVYVSTERTLALYRRYPHTLKSLAMISVAGSIAYLLPYALATQVTFCGWSLSITCYPATTVRMLGGFNADLISIMLTLMIAIIGKRYLKHVISSGAQLPVRRLSQIRVGKKTGASA